MLKSLKPSREKISFVLIEFVLIIAGVLAAITVENWRQSRQDRNLEHEYLVSLRNALQADTAMFAVEIQKCFQKQKAAARLLQLINKREPIAQEDFEQLVQAVIMGIDPFYTTVVFEDLRSTGRLQLIRDEGLRNSIIEYYLAAQHLTEIHGRQREKLSYNSLFTEVLTFEEYTLESMNAQDVLTRLAKNGDAMRYLAQLQKDSYAVYSSLLFISLPSSLMLLDRLDIALSEP